MIAAQNVAAASSLVPNKVTQLAAKVAGHASSEARNSLLLLPGRGGSPDGTGRNSFHMPNSPSISAALSYMQSVGSNDEDKEGGGAAVGAGGSGKKREKRRSAAPAPAPTSFLRPVPEGSAAHYPPNGSPSGAAAASANSTTVNAPPPRFDSLLKSGPRTNLATPMTPQRGMKRRSASLGDVFGGFTPSMAFAATAGSFGGGAEQKSDQRDARNVHKSRPASHGRSNSSGDNGTLPPP